MKVKVDSAGNLLLLCKYDVVKLFCICGIGRISWLISVALVDVVQIIKERKQSLCFHSQVMKI